MKASVGDDWIQERSVNIILREVKLDILNIKEWIIKRREEVELVAGQRNTI